MKSKRRIQPVPPGDCLREELAEPSISMNRLSKDIRVPLGRVSLTVNGKRGITANTALRLAQHFGTSAELWMNLQNTCDLAVARQQSADRIAREVIPADRTAA